MPTTYTSLWRLAILAPLDPATLNSWGAIQDATMPLMEQGAVGVTAVNIAGLTTYSLTTSNNATDQARFLIQNYTGALANDCTVTIPNLQRVGWAQNSTTGGFNVILTAGGTTVTLPPDGVMRLYECDGATNITLPAVGFGNVWQTIANYSFSGVNSQAMPLPTTFRKFRLNIQGVSISNSTALYLQFSSNGGVSYNSTNNSWVAVVNDSTPSSTPSTGSSDVGVLVSGPTFGGAVAQPFDATTEIYPGSASLRATARSNGFGVSPSGTAFYQVVVSGGVETTPALMNFVRLVVPVGTMAGLVILEGLP